MKGGNSGYMSTTIFFGLGAALLLILFGSISNSHILDPPQIYLLIWFYLSIYSILLIKWNKRKLLLISFPLFLHFILCFSSFSIEQFILISLVIFSWMRSGISIKQPKINMFMAEVLFSFGGGFLVASFKPDTIITWALSFWIFFLVQSMFFVFYKGDSKNIGSFENSLERFEKAKRQAEKILAGYHI